MITCSSCAIQTCRSLPFHATAAHPGCPHMDDLPLQAVLGWGPACADRVMWGAQLRVAPSQSKHKLYVGNIPKELTRDTLKEQISAVAKGEAPFLHNAQLSQP